MGRAAPNSISHREVSGDKAQSQRDSDNNSTLKGADGFSQKNCETSGTRDEAERNGEVACQLVGPSQWSTFCAVVAREAYVAAQNNKVN